MSKNKFEDLFKLESIEEVAQWVSNNPDRAETLASGLQKKEYDSLERAATFLVMWVSKECSPDKVRAIAKGIGYNDSPLFFAKKKKYKLVSEVTIANTAIAIFSVNVSVNSDRAKIIIDAYLESATSTMFSHLEKIDKGFYSYYEKRIGVYFSFLQSNCISEMCNSFCSALGVSSSSSSNGQYFLTQEFFKAIKEVHETLKGNFDGF